MKKPILVMILLSFFAGISNAQETIVRDKAVVGLKAGFNYSNIYDSQGEDFYTDPKLGLAGGLFLAIPIGKFLGLQPEILFSQKGFIAKGQVLGSTYSLTRTTNYIDIPLFFSLKPVEFLTLLGGPQFSYLLSQRDEFSNSFISNVQEQDFNNDNVRKNTLCFIGGVDINLNHFVLGARAGWDLQQNNGDGTSTNPRYKNVWYQATLGYRFYN